MTRQLEQLSRRAFLRGLTLTSAGLLVPKATRAFIPAPPHGYLVRVLLGSGLTYTGAIGVALHDATPMPGPLNEETYAVYRPGIALTRCEALGLKPP